MWWVDNPQAKCFHFAEQGDDAALSTLLKSNAALSRSRDDGQFLLEEKKYFLVVLNFFSI